MLSTIHIHILFVTQMFTRFWFNIIIIKHFYHFLYNSFCPTFQFHIIFNHLSSFPHYSKCFRSILVVSPSSIQINLNFFSCHLLHILIEWTKSFFPVFLWSIYIYNISFPRFFNQILLVFPHIGTFEYLIRDLKVLLRLNTPYTPRLLLSTSTY